MTMRVHIILNLRSTFGGHPSHNELGQSVHSVPTYPAGPMCQATGQFRVPHCRQNANSPPIQSDRPNSQVEPTSKLSKSPKSKRSKGRFQRVSESAQRTLFLSHTAHQSHTVVHEQTGRRETLTVQPVLFAPLPSPLSRYSAPLAPRLTGSECSELTGTSD